jgi:Zinc carboxypeptidase
VKLVKPITTEFDINRYTGLLPELDELFQLISLLGDRGKVKLLGEIEHSNRVFPLIGLVLGTEDKTAPTFGLFSGVHGLERIGSRVSLAYLRTFLNLMSWDKNTQDILNRSRFVLLPVINPVGMYLKRRSNGNGVDLMRNAPVMAENLSRFSLYGGHRISSKLPWYRGPSDSPMESESQILCQFVKDELFASQLAISVDVHSGYGTRDRFWFPYAKTRNPFKHLPEVFALKTMFDQTYPNHIYRIEPQSRQYVTHGDLWDYLYDHHLALEGNRLFLPFCLEMGSWLWVKKNIRQAFSILGVFNPIAPSWAGLPASEKILLRKKALDCWYDD